jgi:hypothetical protein
MEGRPELGVQRIAVLLPFHSLLHTLAANRNCESFAKQVLLCGRLSTSQYHTKRVEKKGRKRYTSGRGRGGGWPWLLIPLTSRTQVGPRSFAFLAAGERPDRACLWPEWGQFYSRRKLSRCSFAFSLSPFRLDLYASLTTGCVVAETAPRPVLRRSQNPAFKISTCPVPGQSPKKVTPTWSAGVCRRAPSAVIGREK